MRIAGGAGMMAQMRGHLRPRVSPPLLLSAALFVVFAVSLSLYAVEGASRARRVLLFPDAGTGKLVGEERFLPRTGDRQESVELLVKEMLLGPESIELGRVVPGSTLIRSVMVRDREAYVDLSADVVLDLAQTPLGLADTMQAVANNVYFNFPRLRRVKVYVNGQVPQMWGVDLSDLSYRREMLR